jgi:hypothetical protein
MWLDHTASTCALIRNQAKLDAYRSLVVDYRDLFVFVIVIESPSRPELRSYLID